MKTETIHMSDKSDQWQEEIEDLADENAAVTLSMVLGITHGEAADKLLEIEYVMGARSGFRQFITMGQVLGKEVHTASLVQSYRAGISSHVQFTDKFPTVNQWLDTNPTRIALLRCGNNFVYVGYGMVFSPKIYGFKTVTQVIFLDEEETS